jgi:hypothetical protein
MPVRKRSLFLSFPYVCPEPVLVNCSFYIYTNGSKKIVAHTPRIFFIFGAAVGLVVRDKRHHGEREKEAEAQHQVHRTVRGEEDGDQHEEQLIDQEYLLRAILI